MHSARLDLSDDLDACSPTLCYTNIHPLVKFLFFSAITFTWIYLVTTAVFASQAVIRADWTPAVIK